MQKKYSVLTNAVGMEAVKICEICEKTIAGKVWRRKVELNEIERKQTKFGQI